MKKINLDDKYLNLVKSILKNFDDIETVFAYGSRVRGNNRAYSDLDLAVKFRDNANKDLIYIIKDKFENSALPIRVDVVDSDKISFEFKTAIADNMIELNFRD